VAIKRHEFHLKFSIAGAMPRFASGTGIPAAAFSSSPSATMGLVVDSTTSVLRQDQVGAPHDRSAVFASSGCTAFPTVTATACAPHRVSSPLLPAQYVAPAQPCTCLLEAV
jgi:hypothetical protein